MTTELILFPKFRLECWDKADGDDGCRYALGLSADGVRRGPDGAFPTSKPLVAGTVVLDVHGRDFVVEAVTERPAAMTEGEARVILSHAFEDMGRGSEYTDDLIWRPVDVYAFLAERFYSPRWQQLTRVLLRCVDEDLCRGKGRVS